MNGAVVAAERHAEVRAAARRWRAAGLIDEAARAAIEARLPDDRRRAGVAFRILLFLAALVAGGALYGLVESLAHTVAVAFFFLLVFAVATEVAVVRWQWAGRGAEEAAALLAFVSGLVAVAWTAHDWTRSAVTAVESSLLAGAVIAWAIVWRWGMPPAGAVAAGCLLLWLAAAWDHGRVLVIAASLLLAVPAFRWTRSATLAPSHRRAAGWALVAALGFLVAATNLVSLDGRWLESFRSLVASRNFPVPPGRGVRFLAAVATGALPVAVLAGGLWLRDRLLLWCGTLVTVVALATLRRYVHIAPLWMVLTVGGSALFGIAALLTRLLDRGPCGERGGFTARDRFPDTRRDTLVDTAVGLAASSHAPRPPAGDRALTPGGGTFGGGGASGDF